MEETILLVEADKSPLRETLLERVKTIHLTLASFAFA